jgi:glycosyltransferase involved in cell wall biosynthesis
VVVIAVVSDAYWDDPFWASRHHIPLNLAKEHSVIFIERATTWISPLIYQVPWSRLFKNLGLKELNKTLSVYTPRPRLPFDRRYRLVSRVNQKRLAQELNLLFDEMEISDPHVISFDHKAATLFEELRTRGQRCYYVVDEVSEFNWPLASKDAIIEDEIETIRSADAVIATSEPLMEKCLKYNRRIRLLSHGVDLASFERITEMPEDVREIKKPIVGFVGKIEDWVDVDLVAEAARLLPESSFVLIGPVGTDVEALRSEPNVHLLGPRGREALPAYLRSFACGIIPFKPGKLTHNVNPLKMYEYLAAGIPVVSAPMPAVASKEELGVLIAGTPQEFAARISSLLSSDTPEKRADRLRFAERNSWEKKAKELSEFLGVGP